MSVGTATRDGTLASHPNAGAAVDPATTALVPVIIDFNLLVAAGAQANETRDVLDRARAVAHG